MDAVVRVIAAGEKALPTFHDPDQLLRLHLILARAHGDAVAAAAGVDLAGDCLEPDDYRAGAESARRAALRHYQAALDRLTATDPALARAVWRDAWRLRAGLPPRDTRFVCVYD